MLEAIALFAPPLVALRFYNHLHRDKLSARALVMAYGVFVLLINLCLYLAILYLLGNKTVDFDDASFVNYILFATPLAFVFSFVVNLFESLISVNVKRNVRKK